MIDYYSTKLFDQRRRSSPECFFRLKTSPQSTHIKNNSSQWLSSANQQSFRVFRDEAGLAPTLHKHINKDFTTSLPEKNTAKFLRSFSEKSNHLPPFSSLSSASSYLSSSCYSYNTNSITLPAAPIFANSCYSSIKKKKKRKRASLLKADNFDIFEAPSDNKMMMLAADTYSGNTSAQQNNNTPSDIELATEIGHGLLCEVRRMHSVLQERQESIHQLELEKADNQQRICDLIKQLCFKNETEERLKEDIWNLEITKQDMTHQIRQLSKTISKTHMEHTRREHQENLVYQELESLKTSQLKWQETIAATQNSYETKLAQLNKSLVTLKKEKDVISLQLKQLEEENKKLLIKEESMAAARQKRPSEKDVQALQLSLVQAHGVIESLKSDLENEKQQKDEVDALLRESQETIEQMQFSTAPDATSWCQSITQLETGRSSEATSSVHTEVSPTSVISLEEELLNVERRGKEVDGVVSFSAIIHPDDPYSCSSLAQYQNTLEEEPLHPLAMQHSNSTTESFGKVLPFVMHTMIGEWVFKYTRHLARNSISDKSHKRFFWLHPYTKTLYWSEQEPGVKGGQFKAKSVFIDSFSVDTKHHDFLPGLTQPMILIRSASRDIRFQCLSKASHEKWVQSLGCLLEDDENEDHSNKVPLARTLRCQRLSSLLERIPPSTMPHSKQKWRMSAVNLEERFQEPKHQQKERPHSMIRFHSLRFKNS